MQAAVTPIFLVLAAVIGLLVGLLVANLTSSRDSRSSTAEEPPKEMQNEGFAEAVKLWYSPSGKKIITQLDGEYYRDFLTLSPEQKSRVIKLLTLWSYWAGEMPKIGTKEKAVKPEKQDEQTITETAPAQAVLEPAVAEVIQAVEEGSADDKAEADKPQTIAGQISLIIDRLLEDNPLKEKGIKLIENSHQGVDVWVGLEKFDGIDAIPYPEVQQLIRKAVALWEKESEEDKKAM